MCTQCYKVTRWRHLHDELLELPTPPDHIFGDVKSFYVNSVLEELESLGKKGSKVSWSALRGIVHSGKAVKQSAWCFVHNKPCEHPRCNVHQASPSCVDFAWCGTRSGANGETMQDYAAWCCLRRLLREDIIIIEVCPASETEKPKPIRPKS